MAARKPLSIALLGNAADVYPELVRRGVTPDLVTDQTSAHDTLNGYVPNGMTFDEALRLRRRRPARVRAPRRRQHRRPRRGDGRPAEGRRPHLRLRQQHPRRGEGGRLRRRLRLPRLRAGLHPAAVRPRQRAVPLGGAQRRPAGHRRHRRRPARGLPGQRDGHPLDHDGRREGPLPGPALPHLLARVRRARQGRRDLQRPGAHRQGQGAASSSAATTSTPARSRARTARPRA